MAKVFLVPRNRLTAGGGSVVVNSSGGITLTTASGQSVTIPNGTAAAPGIRTTTNATGFYYETGAPGGIGWGLSLNGALRVLLSQDGGPTVYIDARPANTRDFIIRSSGNGNGRTVVMGSNATTGGVHLRMNSTGSAGTGVIDFANGADTGLLSIAASGAITHTPAATSAGVTALTITQGAHTALTVERSSLNIAAHSLTLADTTTIALMRNVVLGAPTYVGVAAGGSEIVTTGINLEVALPVQGANLTLTNAPVAIRSMGNMIIGDVLSPAAGPTNTLIIASGTAPTSSPDNSVTLYSSDISAGNTEPSFYCEGTAVIATGQADSASSVRVKMRFNGTEVTVLCI